MTMFGQDDSAADFLSGGGEMGRLIRAFDWSGTTLGPLEGWSSPLIITVGLILGSSVPIVTCWGDEGVMIYNDAYAVVAGGRHPGLLGLPVREGWPEVSGFNDRVMKMVLAGGSLSYRDQEMTLHRSGAPETVWMNLDYSPVLDETGTPIGVFSLVVETTARIMAERELKLEEAQREADRARQLRLFEQAPGVVTIMRGPDHVVAFVNETHRSLFNSGDWLGRPVREAIPSVEGQGFFELLDQVYATGNTVELNSVPITYQRTPDAMPEQRYVTLTFSAAHDDFGQVDGVYCLGFEVTESEHARRRSAALGELAQLISDIDDEGELAFAAAEVLARELKVNRAGYGRVDSVNRVVEFLPQWTTPGLPAITGTISFDQMGPFIDDLQRGETVTVTDVNTDPRSSGPSEMSERLAIRSVLNVPVTEKGRLVAVVFVNDDKPRQWTTDEVAFARQIAERTRNAIERRRAEAGLRRRAGDV